MTLAECTCRAELEQALAELDDATQAEADAIAEFDRRNDDRELEHEPRGAF